MAVQVELSTPLAEELSNVVQPKLEEMGWTTGGLDDSALAEYVILMLVNGKTQEQIAAELSNDLLNLGPEDSGAIDFSRWLFEQVELIHARLNPRSEVNGGQLSSAVSAPNAGQDGHAQAGEPDSPDTEMGDVMDVQDGNMWVLVLAYFYSLSNTLLCRPTGPKSMRSGSRPQNRRLMGQISKAMDRTGDSVLHRVRQQGTERVGMHGKMAPKGPAPKGPRMAASRPMGQPAMPNGPRGPGGMLPRGPLGMPQRGPNPLTQMTPQQQMALFQMYEQQARIMSEILSPGQQMMMPGMPAPAINPNFRPNAPSQTPQQPGRSLFDRVENNPRRHNNFQNRAPNGPSYQKPTHQPPQDTEMTNGDLNSSMEVEDSRSQPSELSADTVCKFNLKCTKPECTFAHQSPAAPPGTTIDVHDHCPFGAACKNRKCTARHPSPSTKAGFQAGEDCKFFPNCTNPSCPFRHPSLPICRNGADCKKPGCKFTHVQVKCKFNPCLNPHCVYKHEEGQRGKFGDKVWRAGSSEDGGHLSERKFTTAEEKDEELIIGNTDEAKEEVMGVIGGGEEIAA